MMIFRRTISLAAAGLLVFTYLFMAAVQLKPMAADEEEIVDYIPANQNEIDTKWTINIADEFPGNTLNMDFNGDGGKFRFYAGGYPAKGKTLDAPAIFDTSKPVYLEYDFTVSKGGGGVVFYIGDAGKPNGIADISACILGNNGGIGDGTYAGKKQIDLNLLKSYRDSPSYAYNEENHYLKFDKIYLMATWGSECAVTKLRITGTKSTSVETSKAAPKVSAPYTSLSFIPADQNEIDQKWTLHIADEYPNNILNMDFNGVDNAFRINAGGYPSRGRALDSPVVFDTTKPLYLEYDFTVTKGDGGGVIFSIGDSGKPRGTCIISSCINGKNSEILEGKYSGRKQIDYNLMKDYMNSSGNAINDIDNTLTIDKIYMMATWQATCTINVLRLVGTPANETEVNLIPITQSEIDTQWTQNVPDEFPNNILNMDFSGTDNKFKFWAGGYPSRGKNLRNAIIFDTTKPIYLEYDFTVSDGNGGVIVSIGDKGKANGLVEISGCINGRNGEIKAGTYTGKKQIDYSLMKAYYNNLPCNSLDEAGHTLTVDSTYLTATWDVRCTVTKLKLVGTLSETAQVSFIPSNQNEIDSLWNLDIADEFANNKLNMNFSGAGNRFKFWSGGYPTKGKMLDCPVVFDTTKPVYLEYDFTVTKGDGGGITFSIGDSGKPDGIVNISGSVMGTNEVIKEGTYTGKVQLNYDLIKSYRDSTSRALDENSNTLTIDSIYLMATWNVECTVSKLRVVGTAASVGDIYKLAYIAPLLKDLPPYMIMADLNKLNPILRIYNTLPARYQAGIKEQVENAVAQSEVLKASANEIPSGDTVIDFLPTSKENLDEIISYNTNVLKNLELAYNDDGSLSINCPKEFGTYSLYYKTPYALDATKPIYIQYDFEVIGNNYDGGGGLIVGVGDTFTNEARMGNAILPGINEWNISANLAEDYTLPMAPNKKGTFKGCTKINNTLTNLTDWDVIYDTVLGSVSVGHISLGASYGSKITVKTLKLIGTSLTTDQMLANAVISMISKLPEKITIAQESSVIEAKDAYNALSQQQKALVYNVDILKAAVEAINAAYDTVYGGQEVKENNSNESRNSDSGSSTESENTQTNNDSSEDNSSSGRNSSVPNNKTVIPYEKAPSDNLTTVILVVVLLLVLLAGTTTISAMMIIKKRRKEENK